jgi:hypothetical protein
MQLIVSVGTLLRFAMSDNACLRQLTGCGDGTVALAHAALKSEKLPQSRVIDACSTFRPERNRPLARSWSSITSTVPRHRP